MNRSFLIVSTISSFFSQPYFYNPTTFPITIFLNKTFFLSSWNTNKKLLMLKYFFIFIKPEKTQKPKIYASRLEYRLNLYY